MAFLLCEKDNIQWVTSDVLGTKHLFSRRLGDVGDFPFSSKPDPEWESESRQERVRALWQRFRTAAEFPAEGFCFTRQVHGTVLRYATEAERAMPPLPHRPELVAITCLCPSRSAISFSNVTTFAWKPSTPGVP